MSKQRRAAFRISIRLQKYIADAGIASRRAAEKLIMQGRVRVDGVTVEVMGCTVDSGSIVEVDGAVIKPVEDKVYIMLNKPPGYITTVKDQFGRQSVSDLIRGVGERVYPVGRLDYETSGLIILTNDGDLAFKLTHPSNETSKTYLATVKGTPNEEEMEALRSGIMIEDRKTSPAKVKVVALNCSKGQQGGQGTVPTGGQGTVPCLICTETGIKPSPVSREGEDISIIEITIHEGRNRQVRKMFEALGHPVLRLKRTGVGGIVLGDLKEGAWRKLNEAEIRELSK